MMFYTLAELEKSLDQYGARAASPAGAGSGAIPRLSGSRPTIFNNGNFPNMVAAAQMGLNAGFEGMTTDRKNKLLAAIFNLPVIRALADAPRPDWLRILFSMADAERLGATDAYSSALAWSRTSDRFIDNVDFGRDWHSFKSKTGGITIGTLIGLAHDNGFDAAAWFRPHPKITTVGKPPAWDTVPATMDPATAGQLLNQLLGFARQFGGGPSYFMRRPDGTVCPVTGDALAAILAPHKVVTEAGAKPISAARWWTSSKNRYEVDVVTYDPEEKRKQTGETIENTWRGFAIDPKKGSWRKIRWHLLHVICNGNKACFKYLICWLAHAVQRPGTSPEIMVVMRSNLEGVGKSTVGQLMLRIFGPHGHEATSINEIFGEFNEVIVGKSFILLEENAFPGNHALATAMKGIVTAHSLSVNPKGRPRHRIPNMLHMMLTTNAEWALPAGANARRFFMLDVTRNEGSAYFDRLYAEIESGGVAAMLYDLLKVDLSVFKPRAVPVTDALVRQQQLSADDITQWVVDAVDSGTLVPSLPGGGFSQAVPGPVLYVEYLAHTRGQGNRRPKSKSELGRALKQLGLTRGPGNNPPKWTVPDAPTLLRQAERRAGIRKVTP